MKAGDLWPKASGEPSDIAAHMSWLRDLAFEAGQVIELGVHGGRSTVAILAAIEEQPDGWLWSLDNREAHTLPEYSKRLMNAHPSWIYHQGWSTDLAAVAAAPESCRMLFVDTSHTLVCTRAELALWAPKVEAGCPIVLHDTLLATEPDGRCGVRAAVEELMSGNDTWAWEEASLDWPGLGVLRRRP